MTHGQNINLHWHQPAFDVAADYGRAVRLAAAWMDDEFGPDPDRDWRFTCHMRQWAPSEEFDE